MRKAAEIPEGKGDRGGRVLAEARHRQPTHPSPPSKPRAQSSGEHKQAGRQQQRAHRRVPSARKKRERRRRREGAGPPIRRPAGVCRGCQRAVAEEAILRPNHPCEPCLASPSLYSSMYHHPLLPAHTTQHIRSRHAIAQLSTCPRPYRFASSTRWVLLFNIYHAIMPSCGDASSSASHSTFQRPAVSNKPP